MQSVLKSFSPVINNDVHATWISTKDNRTYYRFTLEWENGDKGTALSSKPTGNYEVGKEYTYEKTENNGRISFNKIKSLESAASSGHWPRGGSGKNSYYENPEVQKRITSKLSLEWASKYISSRKNQDAVTEDKVYTLANNMYIWCFQDVDFSKTDWNNTLLDRRAAMEISVEQTGINCFNINLWADLVKRAEVNYNYLVNHGKQPQPAV